MAAVFAGASRAVLTSVIFAFETTLQPMGLPPLLGGCLASLVVSGWLMPRTIMTEKIARRGVSVPAEYAADSLELVNVRAVATRAVTCLRGDETVEAARARLVAGGAVLLHHGFPVLDERGHLTGVVTLRDLHEPPGSVRPSDPVQRLVRRPSVVVYADCNLRDAVDHMVRHGVGRLPVIERDDPGRVVVF